MLYLTYDMVGKINMHCIDEAPREACGLIVGWHGTADVPSRLVKMRNVETNPDRFCFDPDEQLKIWREMADNGEEPIGVYHSHVRHPAYPSEIDIAQHQYPDMHYLIISLAIPTPDLRSFKIKDGQAKEEPVKLLW